MASINSTTRVSKYFGLNRDQAALDFVDVPIGNDVPVFFDPSRLRAMDTIWANECKSLLQQFFNTLLQRVRANDKTGGVRMLEGLNERNEFHLGLSKGRSKGSGLGPTYARDMWDSLLKSKAGASGLLRDLEDACLFVEGVGPDRISDAVCNILRAPLIEYTQDMCRYYGIPMKPNIPSGPMWDVRKECWVDSFVELPITPFGKLLLVPKVAVRHRLVYDPQNYYTHYLLPVMQRYEKSINSGLVEILKSGKPRVTKKSLKKVYGQDKVAIAEQSTKFPHALDQYRSDAVKKSQPISHTQLAEIENNPAPRFDLLLKAVTDTPVGNAFAGAYENAIESLLTALFYPSLCSPQKQDKLHQGRKRVDITYMNAANRGFFGWLATNYPAANIFVECKNYGKEIENPELDQLAGRFGPSRGKVGLLVCRAVKDLNKIEASCRDTAQDQRGFMICLTDDDLKILIDQFVTSNFSPDYPHLMSKFRKLIM